MLKQYNFSASTTGAGPAAIASAGNSNQSGGTSDEKKEAPSVSAAQPVQGTQSSGVSDEKKEAAQPVQGTQSSGVSDEKKESAQPAAQGNQAAEATSVAAVSQGSAFKIPAPAVVGSVVNQSSVSTVAPAVPVLATSTAAPVSHSVVVNPENCGVPDGSSQREQALSDSERTSQQVLPTTPSNPPPGGSEAATLPKPSSPPPTPAANTVTSSTSTAPVVDTPVGRGKKRKQPTTKSEVEVTPRQTRRKTNSTESVGPKPIDPPKTRGQAKAAQLESTAKTSSPVVVTRTRARLLEKAVSNAATRKSDKTGLVDDPSSTTPSQSADTSSTGAQVSDVGHSSEKFESTAATRADVGGVNYDGTASRGSPGAPVTTSAVHSKGKLVGESVKNGLKPSGSDAHEVKQVGDGLPGVLGVSSSPFTDGSRTAAAADMQGTGFNSTGGIQGSIISQSPAGIGGIQNSKISESPAGLGNIQGSVVSESHLVKGGIQGSVISESPAGTGRDNFSGGHPQHTQPASVAGKNALVHENHSGSGGGESQNNENVTTNQGNSSGQLPALSSGLPTVATAVTVVDKSSTGAKGAAQTLQQVMTFMFLIKSRFFVTCMAVILSRIFCDSIFSEQIIQAIVLILSRTFWVFSSLC